MPDIDIELIDAYNRISQRYSSLKKKPWRDFHTYLSDIRVRFLLPSSGKVMDIGTGNGRNLLLFEEQDWEYFASDILFNLLKNLVQLSPNKTNILNNDMKKLPLREKAVDLALCIATIHHSRSTDEAVLILRNIQHVIRNDGYLILSSWRRWKKDSFIRMLKDMLIFPINKMKNRGWRHGDIYLPWFTDEKKIIAKRYYHLFTKRELIRIVRKTNFKVLDITLLGGKGGKDNIFLLLEKCSTEHKEFEK